MFTKDMNRRSSSVDSPNSRTNSTVEEELDIGRKVKFLHVVNVTKTIMVQKDSQLNGRN